jgi:N-methylhydantoinase A
LSPGRYAGGSVALDKSLAESAVRETVGSPLGISTDEAAIGLVSILEQNLLHAVERISIERGHDPSQCTLVAAGGAGPMHGCSVARALGCRQVYVPRQAGAYCALGMLNADVRRDEMKVLIGDLDTIDEAVVLAQFDQLVELAERSIFEEGFTDQNSTMEKTLGLHYAGQQSYIRVSGHDFDRQRIRAEFESVHQRMFGHIQPDGPLEIGALHATGVGELPRLEPVVDNRPTNRELSPIANRRVFCDLKYGTLVTPLYRGDDLYPGFEATGPLLIEEQTTTIYVGKDDQLTVDTYGNYLIILGGKNDGS